MADTPDSARSDAESTTFSAGTYPGSNTGTAPDSYQPLSLIALLGFGIAVLYGAGVLLIGVVGLSTRQHSLLPSWTLFIPFLSVLMCLVAWLQIRQAEGALAGKKLATYGIAICLLFGLAYWAYFAGVYFAIQQQADTAVRQWLTRIQKKELNMAYYQTLSATKRMTIQNPTEQTVLPALLELGDADQGGRGSMMQEIRGFTFNEYVQLLANGGTEANIELKGLKSFEYSDGGFKVVLRYQVSTDLGTFHILVTAHGRTAQGKEFKGRQWNIVLKECGLDSSMPFQQSPVGMAYLALRQNATQFARQWTNSLGGEQQAVEACLMTLEPQERTRRARDLQQRASLHITAGGPLTVASEKSLNLALAQLVPEHKEFLEGNVYNVSGLTLMGVPAEKADAEKEGIIRDIRMSLKADLRAPVVQIQFPERQTPEWEHDPKAKLVTFMFPIQMTVRSKWNVFGKVVVRAHVDEIKPDMKMPVWWIEEIQILDAQHASGPRGPAGSQQSTPQ